MTLSTHVLDTMLGAPAPAVAVTLWRGETLLLKSATDQDGRCPALAQLPLSPGRYRLSFALADYFRGRGVELTEPPFLDIVSIEFGMAGNLHYHVPLLASPYAYSTYRGS